MLVPSLLTLMLLPGGDGSRLAPEQDRRVHATRISESLIEVDGTLVEPVWASASRATGFLQAEPREGEPSAENTEVYVLYDSRNLYFGIHAHDSEIANLVVTDLKEDFAPESSDVVEIVLDTFRDRRNGYLFSINPAGAKRDAQMTNEGREINVNWDGVWTVKTSTTRDGWMAEIAIPFRTLTFAETAAQTWGLNIHRRLRSNGRNEDSFWSPLPRIYGIQRVSMAGTLEGLEGIRPGADISFKPHAVSFLSQNGVTGRSTGDADVGLDVKYGVTSGLTWDFTYNTDFSQVEADEQQINLTRFSLFFPEKREFFLDNSGIFRFGGGEVGGGGGSPIRGRSNQLNNDVLFFSRTIGLSDDARAVPIWGGSRLTGRAGAYELGVLTMQQRAYGDAGATNFTVARVRRNVWANSDVGVMVLNKEVSESARYNRVVGTDANLRFGQFTTVNSSIARSFTPGVHSRDLLGKLAAAYEDRTWSVRASYAHIGERFTNEMGYTPRRGIQRSSGIVQYTSRPRIVRKWVRAVAPHVLVDYVTDMQGRLDTKQLDYHFYVGFQDGAWLELGKNPNTEVLRSPFELDSTRTIPAGTYDTYDWFITGSTDSSRKLQAVGRIGAGPFYNGYKRTYTLGTTWRLNHKLNSSALYTRNDISLSGYDRFTTDLLGVRFNWSFSTSVFFNALVQYNSDAKQWSSNVRLNIIHRPLSDVFLVYQERENSVTGDMTDRAIIAKLTYLLAF